MTQNADVRRTSVASVLGEAPYDGIVLMNHLIEAISHLRYRSRAERWRLVRGCEDLVDVLDRCKGPKLQERWLNFEQIVWPKWLAGEDRNPTRRWMAGLRVIVMARLVRPSWEWITRVHMPRWVARLPAGDSLLQQHNRLAKAVKQISWAGSPVQLQAISNGVRMLLVRGYASLDQITEDDLKAIPPRSTGTDVLDAALCAMGVFARTPQRGPTRRRRRGRYTVAEMVAMADIPD